MEICLAVKAVDDVVVLISEERVKSRNKIYYGGGTNSLLYRDLVSLLKLFRLDIRQ